MLPATMKMTRVDAVNAMEAAILIASRPRLCAAIYNQSILYDKMSARANEKWEAGDLIKAIIAS